MEEDIAETRRRNQLSVEKALRELKALQRDPNYVPMDPYREAEWVEYRMLQIRKEMEQEKPA